jgi:hypothetical protein
MRPWKQMILMIYLFSMSRDGEENLPVTKSVTGSPERPEIEPDENWYQKEQDTAKSMNDRELFIYEER